MSAWSSRLSRLIQNRHGCVFWTDGARAAVAIRYLACFSDIAWPGRAGSSGIVITPIRCARP